MVKLTLESRQPDSTFCLPNHVPHCPCQTEPCSQTGPQMSNWFSLLLDAEQRIPSANNGSTGPVTELPAPSPQAHSPSCLSKWSIWGPCMPCLGLQVLFTHLGVGSALLPACRLHSKCHTGPTGLYPQPRNENRDWKEHSFAGFRQLDFSFLFLFNKTKITESRGCFISKKQWARPGSFPCLGQLPRNWAMSEVTEI